MEKNISATEARIHFGEVLRRASQESETLIVERNGAPQVAILSVTEYRRLRAAAEREVSWQTQVKAVREQVMQQHGPRPLPASEEIIRQMREDRDARNDDLR